MFKKALSLLLVLVLSISLFSAVSFANETPDGTELFLDEFTNGTAGFSIYGTNIADTNVSKYTNGANSYAKITLTGANKSALVDYNLTSFDISRTKYSKITVETRVKLSTPAFTQVGFVGKTSSAFALAMAVNCSNKIAGFITTPPYPSTAYVTDADYLSPDFTAGWQTVWAELDFTNNTTRVYWGSKAIPYQVTNSTALDLFAIFRINPQTQANTISVTYVDYLKVYTGSAQESKIPDGTVLVDDGFANGVTGLSKGGTNSADVSFTQVTNGTEKYAKLSLDGSSKTAFMDYSFDSKGIGRENCDKVTIETRMKLSTPTFAQISAIGRNANSTFPVAMQINAASGTASFLSASPYPTAAYETDADYLSPDFATGWQTVWVEIDFVNNKTKVYWNYRTTMAEYTNATLLEKLFLFRIQPQTLTNSASVTYMDYIKVYTGAANPPDDSSIKDFLNEEFSSGVSGFAKSGPDVANLTVEPFNDGNNKYAKISLSGTGKIGIADYNLTSLDLSRVKYNNITIESRVKFSTTAFAQVSVFGNNVSDPKFPALMAINSNSNTASFITPSYPYPTRTYTTDTNYNEPDFSSGWITIWTEVDFANNKTKVYWNSKSDFVEFANATPIEKIGFFRANLSTTVGGDVSTIYLDYIKVYNTPLTISKSSADLFEGQELTLTAVKHASVAEEELTWYSDNPLVAEVDQSGKITAVGKGTTVITAVLSGGATVMCKVNVLSLVGSMYTQSSDFYTASQQVSGKVWQYQYSMIGTDEYSDYPGMVSNNKYWGKSATGNPDFNYGLIMSGGIHPGSLADAVDTFVSPGAGVLKIFGSVITGGASPSNGVQVKILKNDTQIWPYDGEWKLITGTAEYPDIYASVNSGDKIRFRVNCNGQVSNDSVTWSPSLKFVSIGISESYKALKQGETIQLESILSPSAGAGTITWESDDESIAGVSANGLVTANSPGITRIIAYGNDNTYATCIIGVGYDSFSGFSEIQGHKQWSYQSAAAGSDVYSDMQHDGEKWVSQQDSAVTVTQSVVTAGEENDGLRVFTAAKKGSISIVSGKLYDDTAEGSSTNVKVVHNSVQAWPASGWVSIPSGGIINGVDCPAINLSVNKGDKIYFRVNSVEGSASGSVIWNPVVTYTSIDGMNNPKEFDIIKSYEAVNPGTEGFLQTDDSLQLAYSLGQVDITSSSSGGTVTALCDAAGYFDAGTSLQVPGNTGNSSVTDIKFLPSYSGAGKIRDISMHLNGTNDQSRAFDFELLYSTKAEPDNFIKFYYDSGDNVTEGLWTYIGMKNLDKELINVDTIRIVSRSCGNYPTHIVEIDINDSEEGADILNIRTQRANLVKLPSIFGSNMILQREKPVPIWGTGGGEGRQVTVSFSGQTKTATVEDGKWSVELDPLPASAVGKDLTVTGADNTITFSNVLVGEVWLCGGQSNMEFSMFSMDNYQADVSTSDNDSIRLFFQTKQGTAEPAPDVCNGSWKIASPATTISFSAVGYIFARELNQRLGIPVGVIYGSIGGTGAEAWVDMETLQSEPDFQFYINNLNKSNKLDKLYYRRATAPFNAMISPIMPFALGGTIFYQGESNANADGPKYYKKLLPALIERWRSGFRAPELPFMMVQIAPYNFVGFKEIREVQLQTYLSVPNTGLIVTTDVGNPNDIHPTNKRPVGERLALAAYVKLTGSDIEYSGPLFESAKAVGDKIVIKFTHVGSGLAAYGGGSLTGFKISGDGVTYTDANAVIVGDTVEVTGNGISNPVGVQYGWAECPVVNLINEEGIPASPFRATLPSLTLSEVKFYNGEGIEVTNENRIPQNGSVQVKGMFNNTGKAVAEAKVVVAYYDNNNKLSDMEITPLKCVLNTSGGFSSTVNPTRTDGIIKVFAVEDLDNIQSLTRSVTFGK